MELESGDESQPPSPTPRPHASPSSPDASSADEPEDDVAAAAHSVASGRGLHTAIVNMLSQFVITAFDARGVRRTSGGDPFSVSVRGVRPPARQRGRSDMIGQEHSR